MSNKVLLGTLKDGEKCYLTKHSWDCDWYWGFGYVGNRNSHYHFSTFLQEGKYGHEVFSECNFTDNDWWVIRDMFVQAYALKKCAEVYRHGGHQTSKAGVTDTILSTDMCTRLNSDLEITLDKLWNYITTIIESKV